MSLRSFVPGKSFQPRQANSTRRPLSSWVADRRQRIGGPQGAEQTSILRHFLTDEGRLFLRFRNSISNLVMVILESIIYIKSLGVIDLRGDKSHGFSLRCSPSSCCLSKPLYPLPRLSPGSATSTQMTKPFLNEFKQTQEGLSRHCSTRIPLTHRAGGSRKYC